MKKLKKLKLDRKTAKLLNRICDERSRLYDVYNEDPCLINLTHFQEMLNLEEDVFEIMGVDVCEFVFSKYREY